MTEGQHTCHQLRLEPDPAKQHPVFPSLPPTPAWPEGPRGSAWAAGRRPHWRARTDPDAPPSQQTLMAASLPRGPRSRWCEHLPGGLMCRRGGKPCNRGSPGQSRPRPPTKPPGALGNAASGPTRRSAGFSGRAGGARVVGPPAGSQVRPRVGAPPGGQEGCGFSGAVRPLRAGSSRVSDAQLRRGSRPGGRRGPSGGVLQISNFWALLRAVLIRLWGAGGVGPGVILACV